MNKTKLLLSLAMLIPTLANASTSSNEYAWSIYGNRKITVTSKDGQYMAVCDEDTLSFVKLEPCNYMDELASGSSYTVRFNDKDLLMTMKCGTTEKTFTPINKEVQKHILSSIYENESISAFFTEFTTKGFGSKLLELYDLKQELKKQSEEEKQ
ncbi:hypothetical protein [Vibrio parahaemolyticus]|uniref:hypothetical protein n=1 Tax=Vibrio parahaemolyticus TaxID=670 RepID=UPI00046F8D1E|nr:hypothetical protein [Vibrio parahaemolyticus]ELA6667947.1 hypothetical protein [Vibrio parahaemolyticus]MQF57105.1 hypothetical protein [Vibrio parahaemolyticus]HBB9986391.1 hypothetical protein [Vibrio parahaemolyticus]HCE1923303.1 hypothetical protein [Vibrio parahaemolyticus]